MLLSKWSGFPLVNPNKIERFEKHLLIKKKILTAKSLSVEFKENIIKVAVLFTKR